MAFLGQPGFYSDLGPIYFNGFFVLKKRTWLLLDNLAFCSALSFSNTLTHIGVGCILDILWNYNRASYSV
jgi:hypothetical protein